MATTSPSTLSSNVATSQVWQYAKGSLTLKPGQSDVTTGLSTMVRDLVSQVGLVACRYSEQLLAHFEEVVKSSTPVDEWDGLLNYRAGLAHDPLTGSFVVFVESYVDGEMMQQLRRVSVLFLGADLVVVKDVVNRFYSALARVDSQVVQVRFLFESDTRVPVFASGTYDVVDLGAVVEEPGKLPTDAHGLLLNTSTVAMVCVSAPAVFMTLDTVPFFDDVVAWLGVFVLGLVVVLIYAVTVVLTRRSQRRNMDVVWQAD